MQHSTANNKIQETVYELLTQQCELAKVQEAKETPSVKVLDGANLPEKKSFPPRLLIMFLGAFLALMIGTVWVLGKLAGKTSIPTSRETARARCLYNDQGRPGTCFRKWNALASGARQDSLVQAQSDDKR